MVFWGMFGLFASYCAISVFIFIFYISCRDQLSFLWIMVESPYPLVSIGSEKKVLWTIVYFPFLLLILVFVGLTQNNIRFAIEIDYYQIFWVQIHLFFEMCVQLRIFKTWTVNFILILVYLGCCQWGNDRVLWYFWLLHTEAVDNGNLGDYASKFEYSLYINFLFIICTAKAHAVMSLYGSCFLDCLASSISFCCLILHQLILFSLSLSLLDFYGKWGEKLSFT